MSKSASNRSGEDDLTIEWSYQTVIRRGQPRAMARSFVSPHLVGHRLYHLVDMVQLVASELAADAIARAHPPVTMGLSKAGDVVQLEVQDSPPAGLSPTRTTEDYRSRFVELLSLHWGLTPLGSGVWVTFDSRPQRHAIHAARRITRFARGHAPGLAAQDSE